ncbi:uncharacterized protein GGS22DRAFT_169269 [Annulohypoxylon maeteangense]|uniref:uncharacterized protein n=1 Tax=Annulohypoxylon maeteangense TaxID=1927788 RepID=UPI002007EA8E|nr:uncharacterized protein GGS22DRAFT_169269 [Annulohypoxylon maeteangense]KAI0883008.1 hypothetical protein GGS22DRAFT_169269 [Annulohypoxylon maeteangense]
MVNLETSIHIGIWFMVGVSLLALALRLYCRLSRRRPLWWDDFVLVAAWTMAATSGGFISAFASPGSGISISGSGRIMTYFNVCSVFCGLASAWSKSAFAITLLRLESGRGRYFLWYALISINASYLLYVVTAWNRPCGTEDEDDLYIPGPCWSSTAKMAVPLSVVVYSAAMDFLLALFPWKIVWKTRMRKQEKFGVALAMSFGILAGIIAIKRATNMVGMDPVASFNYFYGRCIQCVYNLAEPCVSIVAQTIPNLRVLFINDTPSEPLPAGLPVPLGSRKGPGTRGVSGDSQWPVFNEDVDSAKDLRNFAKPT